jgi:HK97 family phage portal protein
MAETLASMIFASTGYRMGSHAVLRSDPGQISASALFPDDEWTRYADGQAVTPSSAMSFAAVQAAHRLLSEVEASLPCHLYRRRPDGRGKDRASDHYLYPLLHDSPNQEMTAFQFWQYMRQNRAAWGNAYALPLYSDNGRWTEIYPLRPDWMYVYRNPSGTKIYDYRPASGGQQFKGIYFPRDIIHVRGMGDDLVGWSPIKLMRQGIDVGMSAQAAQAAFFRNGARVGGILEVQGKLDPARKAEQTEDFNRKFAGAANTGKVLLVDQGSKFVATSIPPDDAQYLATTSATASQIWSIYGIPPHMMGDTEKSTSFGAGIESQVLGFQKFTLRPSLEMTQQAVEMVLLGRGERTLFIEFDMDGFLQADAKTRAEVLAIKRQNGIVNADEWRALDNVNPIGGEIGGAYLVNGTMIPVTVAVAKENVVAELPALPAPAGLPKRNARGQYEKHD